MNYQEEYDHWMAADGVDKWTKGELQKLSDAEKENRFYCNLEFGTGGLRGVMSAGSNRMNVYTVRKATQGLALGVALAIGLTESENGIGCKEEYNQQTGLFAQSTVKCTAC